MDPYNSKASNSIFRKTAKVISCFTVYFLGPNWPGPERGPCGPNEALAPEQRHLLRKRRFIKEPTSLDEA